MKRIIGLLNVICLLTFIGATYTWAAVNADTLDLHDSTEFAARPNNVVIVAKGFGTYTSGNLFIEGFGQYTSINSALDAISPTAENPYLIKVMPGTYHENIAIDAVSGKDNIHIQGAGPGLTIIEPGALSNVIFTINGVFNVTISDLTLTDSSAIPNDTAIWNIAASPTIENIIMTNTKWGIYNENGSSPVIRNSVMKDNYYTVYNETSSAPTIEGNSIKVPASSYGIYNDASSPKISGNTIEGALSSKGIYNAGASSPLIESNLIKSVNEMSYGIYIKDSSAPVIINNTITGMRQSAIYIYSGTAKIVGNNLSNNYGAAILMLNPLSAVSIKDNIIEGNPEGGIYVAGSNPVIITSNQVTSNRVGWNLVIDGSNPVIISHNVMDEINIRAATPNVTMSYNIKSDGSKWPDTNP